MQIQSIWLAGLALGFVLALIWGIQFGMTRLRGAAALPLWLRPVAGPARLRVVQALSVDAKRRVVLLACDRQEVWVLTGGPNDVLLGSVGGESGA